MFYLYIHNESLPPAGYFEVNNIHSQCARTIFKNTHMAPCLKALGGSPGELPSPSAPAPYVGLAALAGASSASRTFPAPTWSQLFLRGARVSFRREWHLGPAGWALGSLSLTSNGAGPDGTVQGFPVGSAENAAC